jgi:hypothetical protein
MGNATTMRRGTAVRHGVGVWLACLAAAAGSAAVLAVPASAALPDGRLYEQVSPPNKNGNVVNNPFAEGAGTGSFGLASANGDSVVFVGTGAMGTAYGGLIGEFAGRRTSAGWETQSAIPRQLESLNILSTEGPNFILPSEDFSSFLFGAFGLYVSAEPFHESSSANIFLSRDPSVEPTWVARPTTPNVIPLPGHNSQPHDYLIAGTSQDLSTAYFTYSGTLVPEDASRAPFVGDGQSRGPSPWGLYEWDSGRLRAAGILPNGTLSPLGAVPAAIAASGFAERANANVQAQLLDNEVSTDGRRVFFVSPDPVASPRSRHSFTFERRCRTVVVAACSFLPPRFQATSANRRRMGR